eukprot:SAG11_NODE_2959_length_2809_cov_3.641328_4_plen_57_part_00
MSCAWHHGTLSACETFVLELTLRSCATAQRSPSRQPQGVGAIEEEENAQRRKQRCA